MNNVKRKLIVMCLLIAAILTTNQSIYGTTNYTVTVIYSGESNGGTVSANGSTIISGGSISVSEGNNITFSISANSGYIIESIWIDMETRLTINNTNTSYMFSNVTTDHLLNVIFGIDPNGNLKTVTTHTSPIAGGTVELSGTGPFTVGTEVTVSAMSNEGYRFKNWTENGSIVSTDKFYTFEINTNRDLTANFIEAVAWKQNGSNIYYEDGKVGIGTQNPDSLLTVNGTVHAKEVKVDLNVPQPDYVFEEDYSLMPLNELESYVQTNKHLPGIPSAKEVKEKGLNAGEMQTKLLEKIEELTLYAIDLKKQNAELMKRIAELGNK